LFKPWNKPVRVSYSDQMKGYGITNWMVGTGRYPWSPWLQLHIGGLCIQVKYYVLTLILIVGSFFLGATL